MCQACTDNYAALEGAAKQEVSEDLRALASVLVGAAFSSGKNPVEIAIALEIARGYLRPQMDDQVLAVVDDLGRRGAEIVLEQFRREGKTVGPRAHEPMAFLVPDEPPRLSPPSARPARAGGPVGRRATRVAWRN